MKTLIKLTVLTIGLLAAGVAAAQAMVGQPAPAFALTDTEGKPVKLADYKGKHVVLLSGDEEYRSEEALPMLAKILSQRHGFHCTVLFALDPDGIFLSNGPGDPEPCTYAIEAAKALLEKRPVFGICLGHQILGLACGGKTYKLKFGHRGANHPVKNLATGQVEVTSQNHGFSVDPELFDRPEFVLTHVNLNDGTVEGLSVPSMRCFSVQYHPEASPGPHDSRYLFTRFHRYLCGEEAL